MLSWPCLESAKAAQGRGGSSSQQRSCLSSGKHKGSAVSLRAHGRGRGQRVREVTGVQETKQSHILHDEFQETRRRKRLRWKLWAGDLFLAQCLVEPGHTKRVGGCIERRPSSPERNSMAGRVCVREEGLFLRNHHHGPMSVHALSRTTDDEGQLPARGCPTGRTCRRTPG